MFPVLTIRRYGTGGSGTFGKASVVVGETERWAGYSLEEQWRDNHRRISCIPAGRYRAQLVDTPHHPDTYRLDDVPGRDAILIHSGNTENDIEGCILLGMDVGSLVVDRDEETGIARPIKGAVLHSRQAIAAFKDAVHHAPDILVAIDWEPEVGERA